MELWRLEAKKLAYSRLTINVEVVLQQRAN